MGAGTLQRDIPIDRALLLNLRGQWSPNMPFYGSRTREEKLTDLFRLRRQSWSEPHFDLKSPFEKLMSDVLNEMHVIYEHEPFTVTMNDRQTGNRIRYLPDFVTDIKIKHRRVVLETHGLWHIDRELLEKYSLFMETLGHHYYFVLVLNGNPTEIAERIEQISRIPNRRRSRRHRYLRREIGKIADEIWAVVPDSPEERKQKKKPKPWDEEFFISEEPKNILRGKLNSLIVKGIPIFYTPGIA